MGYDYYNKKHTQIGCVFLFSVNRYIVPFIDMNAFGDISGRVGSVVILGKKENASQT